MMKYYDCYSPDGYRFLNETTPRAMTGILLDHAGRRVETATWGRPGVVVETKERPSSRSTLRRGPLITTAGGGRLFFDRAVLGILEPLLAPCGQLLDVDADDGSDLIIFKADQSDALAEKRELSFDERRGALRSVTHAYAFDHDRLRGRAAFCLSDRPLTDYFSEAVIQAIAVRGLDGLAFREVSEP